jgi:hypothetical protein
MEKKEYIERGAALLAIAGQPSELHYPSWYKGNIMEVPAADVVEVVRCKDCKHLETVIDIIGDMYCFCGNADGKYITEVDLEDFCSHGEGKEK